MRYVVKFTKESDIKFIAHLDLMRTIHRVIRRSKLPVEYSKGFNPHMSLSIAQPLPVGVYSEGEYLDVIFTEELEEQLIVNKLNESTTIGINFIEAIKIIEVRTVNEKKIPQIAALLEAASYKVTIPCNEATNLEADIDMLLEKDVWAIMKKTKGGIKEIDIKPFVREFKYLVSDTNIEIEALLACGSRENLSPELLTEYLKSNINGVKENSFTQIMRREMYAMKDEALIAISSYFK